MDLATLAATIVAIAAVMVLLSLGIVVGRPLRGSCGGVGSPSCHCSPEDVARCSRRRTDR